MDTDSSASTTPNALSRRKLIAGVALAPVACGLVAMAIPFQRRYAFKPWDSQRQRRRRKETPEQYSHRVKQELAAAPLSERFSTGFMCGLAFPMFAALLWCGFQVVKRLPGGQPHAQRNDPCPCGSGKKFKKCCMKS